VTYPRMHHRGRLLRGVLLVLAVVMALMTAAAPAGASRGSGPVGVANFARTGAIAKKQAHVRGHRFLRFGGFGRKVG
jgi:hypothetical protein